ncbi:MAG: hypothetical protein NZ518_07240, partial [Dehalococcoidia bacterium]|nr:hypothetical protein [Dehalococcoidia bacterium]
MIANAPQAEHIPTTRVWTPLALLKAMRPRQWIKNGAVAMAAVFTVNLYWRPGDLTSVITVAWEVAAAFVVFSALSSVVYLVNDV